jgi:hypothetical protein
MWRRSTSRGRSKSSGSECVSGYEFCEPRGGPESPPRGFFYFVLLKNIVN